MLFLIFFFFLNIFECGERPRAFSTQPTSFTCFEVDLRQSRSNSLVCSLPFLPQVESHTDMPGSTDPPPLCSLSVFEPIVWFVSSLGGSGEHRYAGSAPRSGGTHLAGHLAKGRWRRHHLTVLECPWLSQTSVVSCFRGYLVKQAV